MSNARDKANIPVLNFQSKGIDDNADATAITIDSSERVGIGSTAPGTDAGANADSLVIKKASGNVGMSIITDGSSNANIFLGDTSDDLNALIQFNDSANELRVGTTNGGGDLVLKSGASVEALRIDDTGNVGIGTSSPSAMLELFKAGTTQIKNAYSSTKYSLFGRTGGNYYWSSYEGGANLIFSTSASDNATTERMRIDSSGNVKIGTTGDVSHGVADNHRLIISGFQNNGAGVLGFLDTSGNSDALITANDGSLTINVDSSNATASSSLQIRVDSNEKMRIDSSGNLLIGKSSTSDTVIGHQFNSGGGLTTIMDTNKHHIFNKQTEDGTIIFFRQANSTEGSISVSGATVSYNGFTGTHWSRLTDNSKPTILKGTVLETLDEMCDWYNLEFDVTIITGEDEDGNDITGTYTEKIPHVLLDSQSNGDTVTYNHEGTDYQATIVKEADIKHMKSKVSDTADAKNVYGVFVAYDEDGEGYNDFYVASVGSFVVRIKQGETIAKGDLLQSNGDGTAKVQTDDAVRSSSFAKVLSTTIIETYEDGSYLVPCSLMC
jgi:hypothetical protein